jgi:hypothetical protein
VPSASSGARRRTREFVEVNTAQLLGATRTTGTVIEMADKAGVRMIVRLAQEAHVDDVAKLISVFRRCRA